MATPVALNLDRCLLCNHICKISVPVQSTLLHVLLHVCGSDSQNGDDWFAKARDVQLICMMRHSTWVGCCKRTRAHTHGGGHARECVAPGRRFCKCGCTSGSGQGSALQLAWPRAAQLRHPSRRCLTATRRRVNSEEFGDCASRPHAPWQQIQEASPIKMSGVCSASVPVAN